MKRWTAKHACNQMGKQRDQVAFILFALVAMGSVLAERLCTPDSKYCPVDWTGLYGPDAEYKGGHCGQTDGTLGDPLLTVSSLLLCVPLGYFSVDGPVFTPVASTFIGVASFLFHAANTEVSETLDYVGTCCFGTALLADLLFSRDYRAGGGGRVCVVPGDNGCDPARNKRVERLPLRNPGDCDGCDNWVGVPLENTTTACAGGRAAGWWRCDADCCEQHSRFLALHRDAARRAARVGPRRDWGGRRPLQPSPRQTSRSQEF